MLLIPFLFSFHPRLQFQLQWRSFVIATVGMMALFVPWDVAFTKAGVWGFNAAQVSGAHVFNLPVEELLFFLCISYSCLFTYHCSLALGVKDPFGSRVRPISAVLAIGILIIALLHHQRAYTFTAGVLCALWIGFTAFVQRAPWLGRFYIVYLLLLIPFFVVNGLLTGTGLEQPVVWYSNTENLGLRLLTIPVEDVVYGMLMVGFTVSFFELLRARRIQQRIVRTG